MCVHARGLGTTLLVHCRDLGAPLAALYVCSGVCSIYRFEGRFSAMQVVQRSLSPPLMFQLCLEIPPTTLVY